MSRAPVARGAAARAAACAVLAVAAACDRPPARAGGEHAGAAAADTGWVVTADGYGPIRVGASLATAASALGAPLVLPAADLVTEHCGHVVVPRGPAGVRLMVVDDTVARVEVETRGVRTAAGDQVGDTEAAVLARHGGRARVEPHAYTGPEGHYVVVTTPGDTTRQIVFETDGRLVTMYRAGRLPAVAYIEGCL
jgi:hypothetical protein